MSLKGSIAAGDWRGWPPFDKAYADSATLSSKRAAIPGSRRQSHTLSVNAGLTTGIERRRAAANGQELSLNLFAQFTRERSLWQVHLAQECLVAWVAFEILEERRALHRKEILIPLRECAVQPCERGVLLCAESVGL
jgi:hypothetical protein